MKAVLAGASARDLEKLRSATSYRAALRANFPSLRNAGYLPLEQLPTATQLLQRNCRRVGQITSMQDEEFPLFELERDPEAPYEVQIQTPEGEYELAVTSLIERTLLPMLERDISLSNCRDSGDVVVIEDPLCFQIFLWANPCGNADQPPPAKLYDIEFCSNYNSYATSGRGIPIEEPGGVCVGELVLRDGGQFYFHHRLYTGNWDNGLKILEKSFEQVRPLILDPEKVRDYLISLRDSSVTALVNLAKSRRRVDCEQARTDAAYAQEQISRTSAQCAQQQQKLATVQRRLASARTELSELTKRIEADRQAVRAMPEVDCLSVDDGVIHIRSIELLCQHPAEEVPRNIGTYNLVIRTQDGKASLRVFSRSGGINVDGLSLQAPQIGGDGNISCDWALQLGAYLTRGDLASFLRMVFHHLTTVQPDSFEAGVLESYYPKVA